MIYSEASEWQWNTLQIPCASKVILDLRKTSKSHSHTKEKKKKKRSYQNEKFILWSKKLFYKKKYFYSGISLKTWNYSFSGRCPSPWQRLGTRWVLRALSTQNIPWFYDLEQSHTFIRHSFLKFLFIFDLQEVNISVQITMQETFQCIMTL